MHEVHHPAFHVAGVLRDRIPQDQGPVNVILIGDDNGVHHFSLQHGRLRQIALRCRRTLGLASLFLSLTPLRYAAASDRAKGTRTTVVRSDTHGVLHVICEVACAIETDAFPVFPAHQLQRYRVCTPLFPLRLSSTIMNVCYQIPNYFYFIRLYSA
ncbi:hypothetical protein TraAM80_03270 [Trypanosoma rangeli]|uniref:Uncharacterized protein n=1 Tax=Trypanosoma rangeli TaxID=5698 RepID=A0A422NQ04_TRYRA|nr:uncharacterized protein TraAM80_03270 [Trypanosoma rangeli]RNF07587.1 hypothetical protein TraAM80_03270 [Trypanosoma rangeli]|eukprot:RNF07587.1 hypothetical protein TraAM80_03270 [Trypanosoma rangeli]